MISRANHRNEQKTWNLHITDKVEAILCMQVYIRCVYLVKSDNVKMYLDTHF